MYLAITKLSKKKIKVSKIANTNTMVWDITVNSSYL